MFQLAGALDGVNTDATLSTGLDYGFMNAGLRPPGTLDTSFGTGGRLHLSWNTDVADEQTVAATGTITMPIEGPHAGETFCVVAATLTPRLQGGVAFNLTSLASGVCPGRSVGGSLSGCASP